MYHNKFGSRSLQYAYMYIYIASDDGLESEFNPEAKDPPEVSDDYLLCQFMKYNIKPGQVRRLGVYLNVTQYKIDQAVQAHPRDPAMQAVCVWNEWKKSQPDSRNNCYAYGKLQFVLRQIGLSAVVKHIDPKKIRKSRTESRR